MDIATGTGRLIVDIAILFHSFVSLSFSLW
jgi:hypothetical protein